MGTYPKSSQSGYCTPPGSVILPTWNRKPSQSLSLQSGFVGSPLSAGVAVCKDVLQELFTVRTCWKVKPAWSRAELRAEEKPGLEDAGESLTPAQSFQRLLLT